MAFDFALFHSPFKDSPQEAEPAGFPVFLYGHKREKDGFRFFSTAFVAVEKLQNLRIFPVGIAFSGRQFQHRLPSERSIAHIHPVEDERAAVFRAGERRTCRKKCFLRLFRIGHVQRYMVPPSG